MKQEEQDKLWAELPEKKQKEYKEKYNSFLTYVGTATHLTNYGWGIKEGEVKILIDTFGEHNLKPALTYEDVARMLGTGDFKEFNNKLEAIGKLISVAKFLNKNEDGSEWVPDWENVNEDKWFIVMYEDESIGVHSDFDAVYSIVYFRTEKLANQAIQILGKDIIRTALTTKY